MFKSLSRFLVVSSLCVCWRLASAADATGVWRYDGMPDSVVIICQDQKRIFIAAQHELNGQPASIISYAQGTIDGNKLAIKFKVVRRPNATWGGASGITEQDLALSADGNTITGTWKNDLGQGTAAVLRRVH